MRKAKALAKQAQAQVNQAERLEILEAKIDLIMKHLGIEDVEPVEEEATEDVEPVEEEATEDVEPVEEVKANRGKK